MLQAAAYANAAQHATDAAAADLAAGLKTAEDQANAEAKEAAGSLGARECNPQPATSITTNQTANTVPVLLNIPISSHAAHEPDEMEDPCYLPELEPPPIDGWEATLDDSGYWYYHNPISGVAVWPDELEKSKVPPVSGWEVTNTWNVEICDT